ncbi:hypothetical protein KP79_PYT22310 [Mizuhopecten yessoensis]|uniref:Peptidase S1 domain-containing protein n=2 Tax=Mizuhopecten yessoensis TaxID=6573 RepID=A0A210Q4F9_MIZYE|nr:hypothetical protein KP79_PYT22310 [Mizuhopecten yessoensis]
MGCNIGRLTPEYDAHGNPLQNISGTQGPFVAFNNKIGFLTCAHVLFDIPMTKQSVDFQHTGNTKIEVVQPSVDATTSNGVACGHVYRAIFNPQLIPSVDVAVVELTDFNRIPSKGQFSNAYRSSYLDAGFAELPEYNSGSVQTDLQQISSSQTLVKFGSSSDVTRGTLRVCGVDVRQMTTPLGLPRDRGQAQMINQYQVCGSYPSLQFFLDGDSGSAVFMNTPKTNDLQLIGMAIGCTYVEKSPFFAAVVT